MRHGESDGIGGCRRGNPCLSALVGYIPNFNAARLLAILDLIGHLDRCLAAAEVCDALAIAGQVDVIDRLHIQIGQGFLLIGVQLALRNRVHIEFQILAGGLLRNGSQGLRIEGYGAVRQLDGQSLATRFHGLADRLDRFGGDGCGGNSLRQTAQINGDCAGVPALAEDLLHLRLSRRGDGGGVAAHFSGDGNAALVGGNLHGDFRCGRCAGAGIARCSAGRRNFYGYSPGAAERIDAQSQCCLAFGNSHEHAGLIHCGDRGVVGGNGHFAALITSAALIGTVQLEGLAFLYSDGCRMIVDADLIGELQRHGICLRIGKLCIAVINRCQSVDDANVH